MVYPPDGSWDPVVYHHVPYRQTVHSCESEAVAKVKRSRVSVLCSGPVDRFCRAYCATPIAMDRVEKSELRTTIESYPKSFATRILLRHCASFEAKCARTAVDCSRVQASLLRRTLLHGIASSTEPIFGLPRTFPRVICMLNLSGDYMLLYSMYTDLLRVIITSLVDPYSAKHNVESLANLIEWGSSHKELNVSYLLTGVLPWQEGLGSAYFEIRTVVKDEEGRLRDGQKLINSELAGVRDGSATIEPAGSEVGQREVRALSNHVSAVSVDRSDVEEEETSPLVVVSGTDRETVLRDMADRLRSQRQALENELMVMKESEEKRVEQIRAKIEAHAQDQIVQAQRVREICNKKMRDAEERISVAMRRSMDAEKELEEAKRNAANEFLTLRATVEATEKQKKVVSASAQSTTRHNNELSKKIDDLTKELRDERESKKAEIAKEVERHSVVRDEAVLKARSAEKTIQKLGKVLDRKENEMNIKLDELDEVRMKLNVCQEEINRLSVANANTNRKNIEAAKSIEIVKGCVSELESDKKNLLKETAILRDRVKTLQTTIDTSEPKKEKIDVSTRTSGTDTICDTLSQSKTTQTDPMTEPVEPVSKAEVCRAARVALDRLINMAQQPPHVYETTFRMHNTTPVFKPPVYHTVVPSTFVPMYQWNQSA